MNLPGMSNKIPFGFQYMQLKAPEDWRPIIDSKTSILYSLCQLSVIFCFHLKVETCPVSVRCHLYPYCPSA